MASNFDKNFESNKATFKQKFGKDWNIDPQLYLTYLNTLYISSMTEIVNNGLSQILSRQEDTHNLLQNISQKIK
jgi:hypothetical protein